MDDLKQMKAAYQSHELAKQMEKESLGQSELPSFDTGLQASALGQKTLVQQTGKDGFASFTLVDRTSANLAFDHALGRLMRVQSRKVTQPPFIGRAFADDFVKTKQPETLSATEKNQIELESKSGIKSSDTIIRSKEASRQKKADKAAEEGYEAHKKKYKKSAPTLIGKDDSVITSRFFASEVLEAKAYEDEEGKTVTQKELLSKVQHGDFSRVEQMDVVLRNMAATEYIRNLKIGNAKTPEMFVEGIYNSQGVKGLMNPMLRVGLSLCMHTEKREEILPCEFTAQFNTLVQLQELDSLINAKIMAETMRTVPDVKQMMTEATQGLTEGTPEYDEKKKEVLDSVQRNRHAQVFMAKTLFATHMAKLKKISGDHEEDWGTTAANAFAHCSRVSFILPGQTGESDEMRDTTTDAFLGKKKGRLAGFYRRMAATHAIKRKSKSVGGRAYEEKKKKLGWFIGQNGMNVAIGGLGNDGIPGAKGARKLKNDGSCGHIYMHLEEGNASKYTGVMVGFESDGPGVMNQTGHVHGTGNPEFASSFGGQRTDEIGDKYGGRVVDLSGVDETLFQVAMSGMETLMNRLLSSDKPQDALMLRDITELLSGQRMGDEEYTNILRLCIDQSPLRGKLKTSDLIARFGTRQ